MNLKCYKSVMFIFYVANYSLIVGQFGMRIVIQANVRVASAARRDFTKALTIAYYAGTIAGMQTDGLGLPRRFAKSLVNFRGLG